MHTTTQKRSIACALLLLLIGSGCDQAPLVDKFAPVVPVEPPVSECIRQLFLCMAPDILENSLPEPRALSLFPCAPSEEDAGIDDGASGCPLPVPGLGWRNTSVLIQADEPREVVVTEVPVSDVRVLLEGPVTLRFENVPQLERVEIRSDSPEASVEFDHVVTARVTLGDEASPFAGHVDARHTRFEDLSMNVESFELDSVVIQKSNIAVQRLDSGDGLFEDVVIDVGDGLFAPSQLSDVRFERCHSLSFFGTTLKDSIIPRCEGDVATRLYSVDANGGVIDGVINGEGGTLGGVQLGRYDPSEYALWGVAVGGSMFCDETESLKSTAHIKCSDCTDDAFSEAPACNLEEPAELPSGARTNYCEALNLRTECSAPLPERLRPLRY